MKLSKEAFAALQKAKNDLIYNEMYEIYKANYINFDNTNIQNLIEYQAKEWLHKFNPTNKRFSRRMREKMEKEIFHFHYEAKRVHVFWKIFTNRKGITTGTKMINYVSTPKGKLYFQLFPEDSKRIIAFYSHLFDRYVERTETQLKREDAIKEYILLLEKPETYIIDPETGQTIFLHSDDSITLGYLVNLEDVLFESHQTYLTAEDITDELKKEIIRLAKETKRPGGFLYNNKMYVVL